MSFILITYGGVTETTCRYICTVTVGVLNYRSNLSTRVLALLSDECLVTPAVCPLLPPFLPCQARQYSQPAIELRRASDYSQGF
jgi:hypothetical protein